MGITGQTEEIVAGQWDKQEERYMCRNIQSVYCTPANSNSKSNSLSIFLLSATIFRNRWTDTDGTELQSSSWHEILIFDHRLKYVYFFVNRYNDTKMHKPNSYFMCFNILPACKGFLHPF